MPGGREMVRARGRPASVGEGGCKPVVAVVGAVAASGPLAGSEEACKRAACGYGGLLLLLVLAFQVRLQRIDLVALDLVERGGVALGLPLEAELGPGRDHFLHLVRQLLLALEV